MALLYDISTSLLDLDDFQPPLNSTSSTPLVIRDALNVTVGSPLNTPSAAADVLDDNTGDDLLTFFQTDVVVGIVP